MLMLYIFIFIASYCQSGGIQIDDNDKKFD